MRRLAIAIALIGCVTQASAADFELPDDDAPVLRGSSPFLPEPPTFRRWSGYYVGAQVGYSSAHIDFSGATSSLVAFMLRETTVEDKFHPSRWDVLGSEDRSGASFGGFIGYNSQWEDVIIGLEAHYNIGSLSATGLASPLGRIMTDPDDNKHTYTVALDGSASMRIKDWGAVRMRAGYVMGDFLPYATFGFGIGRADVSRSASVEESETIERDPPDEDIHTGPFLETKSESKNDGFVYGWSVGGGVDYLVTQNLFVRGEFEYINFTALSGVKASIGTARVGAGWKF
jgi:opacity protein-like surface antigen